jgi:hypothetical protein
MTTTLSTILIWHSGDSNNPHKACGPCTLTTFRKPQMPAPWSLSEGITIVSSLSLMQLEPGFFTLEWHLWTSSASPVIAPFESVQKLRDMLRPDATWRYEQIKKPVNGDCRQRNRCHHDGWALGHGSPDLCDLAWSLAPCYFMDFQSPWLLSVLCVFCLCWPPESLAQILLPCNPSQLKERASTCLEVDSQRLLLSLSWVS